MTALELLNQEFEQEAITTRNKLSRVPDDNCDWKPRPKSMDVRTLSTHIGVFLRVLNIPIPGSYGPGTDEKKF